jgi:hypothetical protein
MFSVLFIKDFFIFSIKDFFNITTIAYENLPITFFKIKIIQVKREEKR